jgi:Holliday junction DNA helicase RuvA
MIAQVRGRLLSRSTEEVVVEVGGLGIAVVVTPRTSAGLHVGEPCSLTTHLVVREDSLTLFGFADTEEREVFRILQTVSGVGPRLALTILATLSTAQIREAIAAEDVAALTTAPGVGRKGAQRLIVDLKDRLGAAASTGEAIPATHSWRGQVTAALTGLGWSAGEAQEAVREVAQRPDAAQLPVPEALRIALQILDHTPAVTP